MNDSTNNYCLVFSRFEWSSTRALAFYADGREVTWRTLETNVIA